MWIIDDGSWDVDAFIDEHLSFRHGAHDDQVDAAAEAFNQLAKMRAPVSAADFLTHA